MKKEKGISIKPLDSATAELNTITERWVEFIS